METKAQQAILEARRQFIRAHGSMEELKDGQCFATVFRDGIVFIEAKGEDLNIEIIEVPTYTASPNIAIFE